MKVDLTHTIIRDGNEGFQIPYHKNGVKDGMGWSPTPSLLGISIGNPRHQEDPCRENL